MIVYPLIIMLTHRRGGALCLLKSKEDENPIFMRVLGTTAENLWDTYSALLKCAKLQANEIKTLAVGTGPGSFTGLRLGCAFANGIKLGQNCALISVPTHLYSYFLQEDYFSNEEDLIDFKNQLGEINEDDESSGYVTFYDVLEALEEVEGRGQNKATYVDVLYPNYGREPGPVIKLKEKEKNELERG